MDKIYNKKAFDSHHNQLRRNEVRSRPFIQTGPHHTDKNASINLSRQLMAALAQEAVQETEGDVIVNLVVERIVKRGLNWRYPTRRQACLKNKWLMPLTFL